MICGGFSKTRNLAKIAVLRIKSITARRAADGYVSIAYHYFPSSR